MPPPAPGQLLGSLVGLDDIRSALEQLQASTEGRRRRNSDLRVGFNTLIMGNSGTAKSLVGGVIASFLHTLGITDRADPLTLDAMKQDTPSADTLEKAFNSARGGVLFIDNVHQWFSIDGDPQPVFNQLVSLMEKSETTPVVVIAGLPFRLREFLRKPDHKSLAGRFKNVFPIDDYLPAQLLQIAMFHLTREGFTVPDDTRDRLELRLRHLHRLAARDESPVAAQNGRLALKIAADAIDSYYRRPNSADNLILAQDIAGDIEKRKTIDQILAELDEFVGRDNIKREMRDLHADVINARRRIASGLPANQEFAFHFTLTGNPGTGKTSVARTLGNIMEALGVLKSGHVVEVDRSSLVGEFQGQTALRTAAKCDAALGGVLFIDEAYALLGGKQDEFGMEAINTLLKRMEDEKGKFVVIAAGYANRIDEFLSANPGFPSRFRKRFHLEDYDAAQLTEIFMRLVGRSNYELTPTAQARVLSFFSDRCSRKGNDFGNGREARNLSESVMRAQGERVQLIEDASVADLKMMDEADIPEVGARTGGELQQAMAQLDAMIGLPGVKKAVAELNAVLSMQRLANKSKPLVRHFLFLGNPGTGKTTVAKMLGKIFFGLGMLPTDRYIEVDREGLVAGYLGHTAIKVNEVCARALGGVLLIDEAYALAQSDNDPFGKEAISTLLKRMEDDKGKFVVVATGYATEMKAFLDSNSGMRSRFTDTIVFEDYDADDMVLIIKSMCHADDKVMDAGVQEVVRERLATAPQLLGRSFANARTVRKFFDKAVSAQSARVNALKLDAACAIAESQVIRLEDLPSIAEC